MSMQHFNLAGHGEISFEINQLVIAGWTGRDAATVEHHIAELEAIGVRRPSTVPCFYRVAATLLSTDVAIQVPGTDSSGEVEFVLFATPHGLLVGIGSDHTDRKVESYGVTVSKQMCGKPVGRDLWRFADVQAHWDQLVMRCWRERGGERGGERALYQEGSVTKMLAPSDLIERYTAGVTLPLGTAMFCGTHAVIGEMGFGDAFEVELSDPVRALALRHRYVVAALPVQE
jgi:hypothetical protein